MTPSLLTLLPLFFAPGGGSIPVVFADDTFDEADWQTTAILLGLGSGTAAGVQVQTGNAAPARRVTNTLVGIGTQTTVYGLHFLTNAAYDPALEGAIEEVFISLDHATVGGSHRVFGAVLQGSKIYVATTITALTSITPGVWLTMGLARATETDFVERLPDGSVDVNSHPNFSVSGAPILFGFEANISSSVSATRIVDYDNFFVSINAQPSVSVARLGSPPNPDVLSTMAASGPVIGTTWDLTIDHTSFLPGATIDYVLYSSSPGSFPTNFGTFLCAQIEDGQAAPAGDPISFAVPNNCLLSGMTLCFQGASFDPIQGYLLTNALDVTIGVL